MSPLEIVDAFEPYYDGRTPFACTSGRGPATAVRALPGRSRFGSGTNEAATRKPSREPTFVKPDGG